MLKKLKRSATMYRRLNWKLHGVDGGVEMAL